jgi:hypothetical protein
MIRRRVEAPVKGRAQNGLTGLMVSRNELEAKE